MTNANELTVSDSRAMLLQALTAAVPGLLESQDETGRFGTKPWIATDQNLVFPLAAAWSIEDPANPYHGDPALLEAVMRGGDVLIEEADPQGMWTFRKKDHSTWGQIYQPWTYSRWMRAFSLIREAMPPDRREHWAKALAFGYDGISRTCLERVHNIPTHHAMGLYCAGMEFGREDWETQAREFMARVIALQSPEGWWSEHAGPVIMYGAVYMDSIGHYYAMSGDESVLPALRRGARFFAAFTYPDGSAVETVDERNVYRPGVAVGNVGFTFCSEGRAWLARQWATRRRAGEALDADYAASLLLYGEPVMDAAASEPAGGRFVLGQGDAVTVREGPWFACISAFTAEPPQNRWVQDRQNYLSLFHDRLGVFLGGGNTKLQPLWSTFAVGDPDLLRHTPGDEEPNFVPDVDLEWCADAITVADKGIGLDAAYGDEACGVRVLLSGSARAVVRVSSACRTGKPVEAHLPLLVRGPAVRGMSGCEAPLPEAEPFVWSAAEAGGGIEHAGLRIVLPPDARVVWPALPHDPYKKDGSAAPGTARMVVCLPLSKDRPEADVELEVL